MMETNLTLLVLFLLFLPGVGACAPSAQGLGDIESVVTVRGSVTSIDTSEMAVDGPARLVLDSDQYGDVTVLVASCLGPCVLDAVERLEFVEVGDRWQVTGEVEGEKSLTVYDQAEHSLTPLTEQ